MIYFGLVLILIFLLAFNVGVAKYNTAKEHRFRDLLDYTLEDCKLHWLVDAFAVFRYDIVERKKIHFHNLQLTFKGGKLIFTPELKRDIEYLANLMLQRKEKYFLNKPHGIRDIFHLVIFRKNGKTYALESFDELKSMLGKLNTPAEILLWVHLKNLSTPYSYQYKKGIWRLRYKYRTNCGYGEYFIYYDSYGNYLREKAIKNYRKKNCDEIIAD